MKLIITRDKGKAISLSLVLVLFEFISLNIIKQICDTDESTIIVLSWVSIIALILLFYSWRAFSNELLSTYTVFLLVLYLFTCGQCIGWALGLNMGNNDLMALNQNGISCKLIIDGIYYSVIGITVFHIGALFNSKLNSVRTQSVVFSSTQVVGSFKRIGKNLLFICIPAFIAIVIQNVMSVSAHGYLGYYQTAATRSTLMIIVDILADFYQPCLLILLIGYRNSKVLRRIIILAMMLDVVVSLYIGARSAAVMAFIGIIVAYHYFVSPLKLKHTIIGTIVGYFGLSLLSIVSAIRLKASRTLLEMFAAVFSNTNVIGNMLGEIGGTMATLTRTMYLVPDHYSFRYGMSYLAGALSWVPSFFFPGVHPSVKWANLADWLQRTMGLYSGPGYTMFAESYINFGWFGWVALFVEGAILAMVIARVPRKNVEDDVLGGTFQIVVIMTIMKSLVRSSVSVALRTTVLTIIPLYIIIRLSLKREDKR